MSNGTPMTFRLPEGWTVRKVATALVREWLAPFRAERVFKAARWVVQPVVETPESDAPLWEPGISTADYEERMDRADLTWAIRASSGRGKGIILARLSMSKEQPFAFDMVCCREGFPETLFDHAKLEHFLPGNTPSVEELFSALLTNHGFQPATAQP